MRDSKDSKQVSELSYHGPLIGMRSTRPASAPAPTSPAKKSAAPAATYSRKIAG
ncbi:MAG TPA: hypothetical protein VFQ00_14350 [Terriglobales bacterium]|nr:hypothetical protein [Terriglobales bacterium]